MGSEFKVNQYDPMIHCSLVESLAMVGLSKREIATNIFKIKEKEFNAWIKAHPEFEMAYNNGNLVADAKVTKALFDRAVGVTVTKQKIDKMNQIVELEEELPPDANACTLWLARKQSKVWSKDAKVENTEDDALAFLMGELSDDMRDASVLPSDYEDVSKVDG